MLWPAVQTGPNTVIVTFCHPHLCTAAHESTKVAGVGVSQIRATLGALCVH